MAINLANELKTLSAAAQAEVKAIIAKAGGVVTEAEGFVLSPLAYVKAHWETLLISFAFGLVCGAFLGHVI